MVLAVVGNGERCIDELKRRLGLLDVLLCLAGAAVSPA